MLQMLARCYTYRTYYICISVARYNTDVVDFNMSTKVALITGANRGIGYQTCLELARRNWKIVLADKDDLSRTKNEIQVRTKNMHLVCKNVDLSSNVSIRCFVKDLKSNESRLDVLINNAGIFTSNNPDGNLSPEAVLQVNHLGPFLMTHLLSDILIKSSPSRVVFVSSSGAFLNTLHGQNHLKLNSVNPLSDSVKRYLVYYNSKLLAMLTAKEFSRRFQRFGVTVNCVHPGMTRTDFLKMNDSSIFNAVFSKLVDYSTQDVNKSGKLVAFMAASQTLGKMTGRYFEDYRTHEFPKVVDDCTICRNVWEESKQFVELKDAEEIL